jgi:hypothetical protein
MEVSINTVKTVKRVSRREFLNDCRSTHTQKFKNKKRYSRKPKHKKAFFEY